MFFQTNTFQIDKTTALPKDPHLLVHSSMQTGGGIVPNAVLRSRILKHESPHSELPRESGPGMVLTIPCLIRRKTPIPHLFCKSRTQSGGTPQHPYVIAHRRSMLCDTGLFKRCLCSPLCRLDHTSGDTTTCGMTGVTLHRMWDDQSDFTLWDDRSDFTLRDDRSDFTLKDDRSDFTQYLDEEEMGGARQLECLSHAPSFSCLLTLTHAHPPPLSHTHTVSPSPLSPSLSFSLSLSPTPSCSLARSPPRGVPR